MSEIDEGCVVIVDTGQAGTVVERTQSGVEVLLRNGDIWRGTVGKVWVPQTEEELGAAIENVDRLGQQEKQASKKKRFSQM